MMNINDKVIYGANGVCEVTDITKMNMSGVEKEYYVLQSLTEGSMCIYVPVDNANIKELRLALDRDEAERLISEMTEYKTVWFDNERRRREEYTGIIDRANPKELLSLIKTLYLKKQEREASGKRLYVSDETFMKAAEKLLYKELGNALGIESSDVPEYISSKISGSISSK